MMMSQMQAMFRQSRRRQKQARWYEHQRQLRTVVLVVESEALIRISTRHMIEDAGFAVAEASHSDEAIRILKDRAGIRAVFTDIRIPGSMDGWKLARAIRGRWPPIHLILASALVPDLRELPANGRFIQKPYTAEHVSAALYDLFSISGLWSDHAGLKPELC